MDLPQFAAQDLRWASCVMLRYVPDVQEYTFAVHAAESWDKELTLDPLSYLPAFSSSWCMAPSSSPRRGSPARTGSAPARACHRFHGG